MYHTSRYYVCQVHRITHPFAYLPSCWKDKVPKSMASFQNATPLATCSARTEALSSRLSASTQICTLKFNVLHLYKFIFTREKEVSQKKWVGCWVMWCEADAAIARWETFWSSFGINTFLSIRRRCTELSVALQSGVEELAGCYPHLTFYCAR